MIAAKPPELVSGLLDALTDILRDERSTEDERRTALAVRVIVRHHVPDHPPLDWACQLCGEPGQVIDCTYPCDLLRVFANMYGVLPVRT